VFHVKLKSLFKAAAMAVALAVGVAPAGALVTDPNRIIPARTCGGVQAVCYVRATINFNDPRINSGVWFATLPANAYVLAIDVDVTTQFNTGTLTMGVTATGTDFLAGSGGTSGTTYVPLGTPGVYHLTTAAGLGVAATTNTTGAAIPVYVRQVTTATAGVATIVIAFIKNDDQ
jgi:hypothetical protein